MPMLDSLFWIAAIAIIAANVSFWSALLWFAAPANSYATIIGWAFLAIHWYAKRHLKRR